MDYKFNSTQVGEFLGLSDRRVRKLAEDGTITRIENDKFDMRQVAEQYYRFKFGAIDSKDYEREKMLHERIKREKAELQLSKMRNEVYDAAVAESFWTGMITTTRNRFLSIPQKIAPQVIGIKDVSKIYELIDNEIRLGLEELSDVDPKDYMESFEIEGEEFEELEEVDKSTSEKDN